MTAGLLAIDPGNTHSGVALIDTADCRPLHIAKVDNDTLLQQLRDDTLDARHHAIEMVASYGMAVGREVFETCVWIGRFHEAIHTANGDDRDWGVDLVFRRDVKLHMCGQTRAKDANIRQALVDRFAPGEPNHGKGTKARPGWFYGFGADIWQAYALAVTMADRHEGRQP